MVGIPRLSHNSDDRWGVEVSKECFFNVGRVSNSSRANSRLYVLLLIS